jgi:hypothetical protein
VSKPTPRMFWTFLFCGTFSSCLVLWARERLHLLVEAISPEKVLPRGLFGALVLTCVSVLPAQAFVTVVATLFFSFFGRVPIWFVVLVVIPMCGLIVAYRDISDRYDTIQTGDFRKLLHWSLVIAPGELLGARLVSRATGQLSKGASASVGE